MKYLHCVTDRDGHRQTCLKCMEAEAWQQERRTKTAGDQEEERGDIVHLYKFPFIKLQTCIQNMKNLKQDDVIFSTDIYSKYSPLIYNTLKYTYKQKIHL